MEITLALIKPHIISNKVAFLAIKALILQHFTVLDYKEILITNELSEKFYHEHKGKFFYNRLITCIGSGPCHAFIIQSDNCVKRWRDLMGPTKVFKAIYSHPKCIRAMYGLSDTRNACHGSDSEKSALKEISILFPDFKKNICSH